MPIKFPFTNNKKQPEPMSLELEVHHLPKHVAIIMDGNGRWAKNRGMPRIAGHKEGMGVVKRIVRYASDIGIKVLTLYAFSTENWKRPKNEVEFLMKLPVDFLSTYLPELIERNVQVRTIGDFDVLPAHTQKAVKEAIAKTKDNDGLILNFALNYGSRFEMVHAVKQIASKVQEGEVNVSDIDESMFSSELYTSELIDPDLLIRTSGEQRLSNFLLWQLAYAEFWFTEVYWPDFNESHFEKALYDFQNRKRRFGGV
ncbi:Undecaprenyl pyrophosphate synthetase [Halobacillus karajensis]|uniref:Isoprenyl transferase n=1 Tax=Halobacillus karajensis TaxID=195088 RepID=A0A024P283_9BACI|nr:isoprenyl transferase [Halobacillus karajensis]CDQ19713.1 Ditrans,polycis-undecaprenyl-diphosphate synthase ((2E,6E)-farnesyl-diphosphate specific) [Halobacillus karajensis]CDQ22173.1 Ditrans,polycis-undecaprenyl-diphosphate synthase ((2E,6E)-farnesyl-diphosphate specific) [Halobacillus karajensis]CDQ28014.1 Ditrans,polycis-undecaprenyl-diphosphate synthase ((2E,6E)-farnesyl-diphosphate specific) [Halobacillus karajensis]SEH73402.1 Undecaprenyl pyrophosphate synthetase [Halobacillus karajens